MSTDNQPVLLTIDDEYGMRAVIMGAAEMEGYVVHEAGSKTEIFHALNSPQIDVIVLDVSMPDMDGIEVIWELVRRESKAKLIILSGFEASVIDAAMEIAQRSGLNVVACMTKPVDITKLREVLAQSRSNHPTIDEAA